MTTDKDVYATRGLAEIACPAPVVCALRSYPQFKVDDGPRRSQLAPWDIPDYTVNGGLARAGCAFLCRDRAGRCSVRQLHYRRRGVLGNRCGYSYPWHRPPDRRFSHSASRQFPADCTVNGGLMDTSPVNLAYPGPRLWPLTGRLSRQRQLLGCRLICLVKRSLSYLRRQVTVDKAPYSRPSREENG